ncbi:LamG domain-containing protein [Actinocatenispora sera]|uniref:LamG domain-containing protein n=1 Tax=Actinocatenispora sera TaxID=390989 RepID=UPI0033DDE072
MSGVGFPGPVGFGVVCHALRAGMRRKTAVLMAVALAASLLPMISASHPASAEPACSAEAPDEASAVEMAVRCGQRVEVLSGRTESSQVFAETTGRLSLESAVEPERVHKPDGSWAAVDPTLHAGPDGRLVPAASVADESFSSGGSGPLVELVRGGHTFTISWPHVLPAPTVSGDSATYAEVLPGVDLRVTATSAGFRHDLIVKTAEAAANPAVKTIRYALGGDAVAGPSPEGGVRIAADGRPMAEAGGAVMWDSSPQMAGLASRSATDEPADGAKKAAVDTDVVDGHLQLTPDPGVLGGADTVYPVVVDPYFSNVGAVKWAWANSSNANWTVDDAWVGVNPAAYGGDGRLYRSFFRFPTSSGGISIKGKYIYSAKVSMNMHHSYSCDATAVSLYRTSAITATPRSNWGSMVLQKYLDTTSGHANKDACPQPDSKVQFTGALKSDLQYGVKHSWSAYTVGLVANDSSHSGETLDYRWKTFWPKDAKLIVDFDSYPGKPTSRTTATVGCTSGTQLLGTAQPALKAKFSDADTTQDLTAYFEWQEIPAGGAPDDSRAALGTKTYATMRNGQYASVTISSGLVSGHTYAWKVRAKDPSPYSRYGSWSDWCVFKVDTTKPDPPQGTSSDYDNTDDTPHGGPGISGTFTISWTSTDVVSLRYGWSTPPAKSKTVTLKSTSTTLTMTPPRYGTNVLYLQSVDQAGNTSSIGSYNFEVAAATGPKASWRLEKWPDGKDPFASGVVGGPTLTPTGLDWVPDARLVGSDTASFSGSGSAAATTVPVVDTGKSFSFTAWVLPGGLSGSRTVVAQDGTVMSSFRLQYREDKGGKWCMTARNADASTGVLTFACGASPAAGQWTHLAGVYDQAEGEIRLYVNGALSATAAFTMGWNATGPTTVGRAKDNGNSADRFPGQIADVRVYDRVIVAEDITEGTDDWPALMNPIEVGDWNFEEGFGEEAADSTAWNRNLTWPADGAVTFEQTTDLGYAGSFNGTSGYATTAVPAVRTDQSFSVAASVKVTTFGDTNQTAVAQSGTTISGFYLGYRPSTGSPAWGFAAVDADADRGATWRTAQSPTLIDENDKDSWVQLVGVYDAAAGKLILYVDGERIAEQDRTTSWNATGPLTVGGGRWAPIGGTSSITDFWNGAIDDVHLYAGALTDSQVTAMADSS